MTLHVFSHERSGDRPRTTTQRLSSQSPPNGGKWRSFTVAGAQTGQGTERVHLAFYHVMCPGREPICRARRQESNLRPAV